MSTLTLPALSTIIHEASHQLLNTVDNGYGVEFCVATALSDPAKAFSTTEYVLPRCCSEVSILIVPLAATPGLPLRRSHRCMYSVCVMSAPSTDTRAQCSLYTISQAYTAKQSTYHILKRERNICFVFVSTITERSAISSALSFFVSSSVGK